MLKDVYKKSLAGEITKKDAAALLKASPFELFETADRLREELVGRHGHLRGEPEPQFHRLYRHVPVLLVPEQRGLRAHYPGDPEKVGEAKKIGATEVCIQGGLRDDVGLPSTWT